MIHLSVLCNAGVCMESNGSCLLIDAVNQSAFGFYGLPDAAFSDMLNGTGVYRTLSGVLFTHCHPDHFDPARAAALQARRPDCRFFIPDAQTPVSGRFEAGPFRISYFETPHMPQDYSEVRHFVFYIEAEGASVYLAADAAIDPALHGRILSQFSPPDYLFLNPVYLAVPSMRRFLAAEKPGNLVVYHLPEDPGGTNGICRKWHRTLARFQDELPPIQSAEQFPAAIKT